MKKAEAVSLEAVHTHTHTQYIFSKRYKNGYRNKCRNKT